MVVFRAKHIYSGGENMLKRLLLVTGAFAVSLSVALVASPQSQSAAAAPSPAQSADKKINLEGCVYPASELPAGGQAAAQQGQMKSYVLTDAKIISISPGVNDSVDRVFTLEQVPQERLSGLSGKRADVSARVAGSDQAPQLQVISIIETVGACPAKPQSRS
jgi:hypothetical protein